MVIKGLKWLLFEERWRTKLETAEKRDHRNGCMEVTKIMRTLRGHVGLGSSVPFLQKVKGHQIKIMRTKLKANKKELIVLATADRVTDLLAQENCKC